MVDTIRGTAGADLLEGTEPGFVVFADGGNDAILSHDCFIEIDAGYGDDNIDIGGSAYQVLGGDGNDTIIGWWNFAIFGGTGLDELYGGDGDDLISGGGDDTLSGGAGNDLLLQADIDGDGIADMEIALTGLHILSAGDFIL